EIRNRYIFNSNLEDGEIKQVEWAADGADVLVHRVVLNRWGEQRDEDYFQSEYEPWSNVYEYGPNTVLPSPPPTQTPEPETPTPESTGEAEAPAEATPTSGDS
ncbi:MAG: hypothetical protein ACPG8W_05740, partial [Candidatus Promineifilaceae bacterium]